jgi:hypothetical protein
MKPASLLTFSVCSWIYIASSHNSVHVVLFSQCDSSNWISCPVLLSVLVISFGATKPPAHPEDWDKIRSRNVGKSSHPDAAVYPRKFRLIFKLGQARCVDQTNGYVINDRNNYENSDLTPPKSKAFLYYSFVSYVICVGQMTTWEFETSRFTKHKKKNIRRSLRT